VSLALSVGVGLARGRLTPLWVQDGRVYAQGTTVTEARPGATRACATIPAGTLEAGVSAGSRSRSPSRIPNGAARIQAVSRI
jgi:hypothetical protein